MRWDLATILSTIFKHKLMILVSFVLITGLCCASIIFYLKFIYKPVYEAKSLILVKPGWESQDIDLSPDRRQANVSNSELLATEVRILQSRELAEKIINTMKPEVIFPDLAQGIRAGLPVAARARSYRFDDRISRSKAVGGNILEVSFKGANPASSRKGCQRDWLIITSTSAAIPTETRKLFCSWSKKPRSTGKSSQRPKANSKLSRTNRK